MSVGFAERKGKRHYAGYKMHRRYRALERYNGPETGGNVPADDELPRASMRERIGGWRFAEVLN